ncbi:MAG: FecR domain-containing protein, partial [Chloroflexota bacterium]
MRHFLIVALVCGCVFTVAQAQTEEFAATLRVLAPNVTYQRTNTSELLFVSQETIVGSGDTIQTRHSGRARLVLFGDGSRIDIEPDTTLIINTLENDEDNFTVRLTLLNGETRHRVLRTAGDDSIYEVQTDTGTITGSAGEFLVIQRDEQVTFLATVGDLTISHGDEETTSVPEGQGGRITPDGIVSDIVSAGSLDVLAPLLDGCPGEIIPIENRLLPVYLAPDAESLPLGTVNPYEVESISGSVIDRSWFRVPYNRSGGWVPAEQIEFVDTVGCAALRVYA